MAKKYGIQSETQKTRQRNLLCMLIKCMLPISIMENLHFKQFLENIDPPFNIPCRFTVRETCLSDLKKEVISKLKDNLTKLEQNQMCHLTVGVIQF